MCMRKGLGTVLGVAWAMATVAAGCGGRNLVEIMGDAGPAVYCGAGLSLCGQTCVDTRLDPTNCGGCGVSCAQGTECNRGACAGVGTAGSSGSSGGSIPEAGYDGGGAPDGSGVDARPQSARDAAGSCGVASCDGACIELASDPSNCGACGNVCASGQVCRGGSCADQGSIWPTLGGGTGHSGFNPVETGRPHR